MDVVASVAQSLITIVIFITILTIIVVFHEAGHFFTARLAGIRVHEFGIGFPPRAKILRAKGETLYTLNWLPIGGFVRLEGEDGESDDPRSFVRAALPVKVIVLVAGVADEPGPRVRHLLRHRARRDTPGRGDVHDGPAGLTGDHGRPPAGRSDRHRQRRRLRGIRRPDPVDDFYSLAGQTVSLGIHGPTAARR